MHCFQTLRGRTIVFLLWIVPVCGCGSKDGSLPTASITPSTPNSSLEGLADPDAIIENPTILPALPPRQNPHPEVIIQTSLGNLRVRLDAENAPETVDNFLGSYVKRGFYSKTIFHYVESGFIIIGGGYTQDLKPKETRTPIRNEAHNGIKNKRGTIAMSRQEDYIDSATSQFFFNLDDNDLLDHDPDAGDAGYGYCVFGEVVEGLDVLEKMAEVAVHNQGDFQNLPIEPIVIETIRRVEKRVD